MGHSGHKSKLSAILERSVLSEYSGGYPWSVSARFFAKMLLVIAFSLLCMGQVALGARLGEGMVSFHEHCFLEFCDLGQCAMFVISSFDPVVKVRKYA